MLARLRSLDDPSRWWLVVGVLAALVAVPFVVSGPGNDLDVANVFRSGRAIARHLDYVPSRPPGAPVHEAIVERLDLKQDEVTRAVKSANDLKTYLRQRM